MNQDLVTELINALTILPGVGKKSAQRMALYLLDRNKDGASILASTLEKAIDNIQRCESCRMLTSNNKCNVCLDSSRDSGSICVVESPSDVLAIESTGGFRGKYFVLLGRSLLGPAPCSPCRGANMAPLLPSCQVPLAACGFNERFAQYD